MSMFFFNKRSYIQGSGACLDQLTSAAPPLCWHSSGTYDYVDDDLQVRLLNKLVQLCYVSVSQILLR